ncbi:MAG: hypothetical protein H0S79_04155 [Anaerolineaceae bacterium]|nr:hypothetical protein [Anaerolineaceae bacterium]
MMIRRTILPLVLILSAIFFSACSQNGAATADSSSPTEETETIAENSDAAQMQSETMEPEESAAPQSGAVSACYHPFFPISEGAFWTFQEAGGQEYTLSVDQPSGDTFTLKQVFDNSDLTLEMDWYCSEDGLLNGTFAQVDLFDQMTESDSPEITFETLEWEGSTLPPAELMAVGYHWTANYQMAGEMNIEGITSTTEVHVKIDNTIGAIEEVTVPAGTFSEAHRVDSVGEIEMVLAMGETVTPLTGSQFTYSTWYVEGIGMVKSSDDFSGLQADVALVASSLIP